MGSRVNDPLAPATKPQLRFAADLDIQVWPGIRKGEISELIDAALHARAPSEEQRAFAKALGINVSDDATFDDVSALISEAVRIQSIKAMQDNPALRAGKVIVLDGRPYRITFIGGIRGSYHAKLEPLCEGIKGYVRRQVYIITIAAAVEACPALMLEYL